MLLHEVLSTLTDFLFTTRFAGRHVPVDPQLLLAAMLGASMPSLTFSHMIFRIALFPGANGLRLGCDQNGCLKQHADPGAQVYFAKCAQQQMAKVAFADDAYSLCVLRE